jgi:RimJ/RimL family protein N-acetyltransferase
MNIKLMDRTKEHVIEFWDKTQDEEIQSLFPFSITTLEESIELFSKSQEPKATSFGKTIYLGDTYVGDVWVYCIDEEDEMMAMLSIVIFDKNSWGNNVGPKAIDEFSQEVFDRYKIHKIGAFTYSDNTRSIRALEKSSFAFVETFVEDNRESKYYERER